MKIRQGFVLREVSGRNVVVAMGKAAKDFHGMVMLNDTGKEIWNGVQQGLDEKAIAKNIAENYMVDEKHAEEDVKKMIQKMMDHGFLEQ